MVYLFSLLAPSVFLLRGGVTHTLELFRVVNIITPFNFSVRYFSTIVLHVFR